MNSEIFPVITDQLQINANACIEVLNSYGIQQSDSAHRATSTMKHLDPSRGFIKVSQHQQQDFLINKRSPVGLALIAKTGQQQLVETQSGHTCHFFSVYSEISTCSTIVSVLGNLSLIPCEKLGRYASSVNVMKHLDPLRGHFVLDKGSSVDFSLSSFIPSSSFIEAPHMRPQKARCKGGSAISPIPSLAGILDLTSVCNSYEHKYASPDSINFGKQVDNQLTAKKLQHQCFFLCFLEILITYVMLEFKKPIKNWILFIMKLMSYQTRRATLIAT
uniref:Uncharacterized protein n=1 Tax=Glossina pallidipes TaxID=7398 RepID=A0A1B0ACR7_GLOPL